MSIASVTVEYTPNGHKILNIRTDTGTEVKATRNPAVPEAFVLFFPNHECLTQAPVGFSGEMLESPIGRDHAIFLLSDRLADTDNAEYALIDDTVTAAFNAAFSY